MSNLVRVGIGDTVHRLRDVRACIDRPVMKSLHIQKPDVSAPGKCDSWRMSMGKVRIRLKAGSPLPRNIIDSQTMQIGAACRNVTVWITIAV